MFLNSTEFEVIFHQHVMEPYDAVKVFSATKAADRDALGAKATAWLAEHPEYSVARAIVTQSSDASFHCLTLVFFMRRSG